MKDIKKQELVKNILNSNLRDQDKEELVKFLNEDDVTLDNFVQYFVTLIRVSKPLLKFFDIDIGDD